MEKFWTETWTTSCRRWCRSTKPTNSPAWAHPETAIKTSLHSWLCANGDIDRLDLELLAARALGASRANMVAFPETKLTPTQERTLGHWAHRRRRGEPLAYILGEKEFFGLKLGIGPEVLVPRPETEQLIDIVRLAASDGGRILDLGTGSGCIAIAIKAQRPDLQVTAIDLSAPALARARRNASRHGLEITFLQSDWFSSLGGQFDWIIANPPYVADRHPALMTLEFEPRMALAGGPRGLNALHAIIDGAGAHLHPGGRLGMEHGHDQGSAVRARLRHRGFACIETRPDLSGHPRVTIARKPGA